MGAEACSGPALVRLSCHRRASKPAGRDSLAFLASPKDGRPGRPTALRCDLCRRFQPPTGFYRALGYAEVGARTDGNEVQRGSDGGGFTLAEVQRCVMRKPLPAPRKAGADTPL